MHRLSRWYPLAFVLLLPCAAGAQAPATPAAAPGAAAPDLERIARNLVELSAHVQQGEIVMITGRAHDTELLENIAVHVRRQGAFPILLTGSDRLQSRMLREIPEQFDSQTPRANLKLAEIVDAVISVDGPGSDSLAGVLTPTRVAARAKAGLPVAKLMEQRKVRVVNLGNDLYPSPMLARNSGVDEATLSRLFWSGAAVEPTRLAARAKGVQQALSAGREVRVTHPNGTDLRFRIEGRPALASDGEISAEDRQRGAGATTVWLPAGEVYVTPVAGSAKGRLVVPRHRARGQDVTGLSLRLENGKVTEATAASGLEAWKPDYDAAGAGKDELSVLDIGVNDAMRIPEGSRLTPWVADGMVTLSIGSNVWAGGQNMSEFGDSFHLPGATVTVDGRPLVKAGRLQAGTQAAAR